MAVVMRPLVACARGIWRAAARDTAAVGLHARDAVHHHLGRQYSRRSRVVLRRSTGAWAFVLWGLVFLQFVIPFFAMLSARVRSRPIPLLVIAGGTLALRFVESFLLTLPAADAGGAILWLAIPAAMAATIGVLGSSLQFMLARMERSAPDTRALPAAESA